MVRHGARELATGAEQLADGTDRLADGMKPLAAGIPLLGATAWASQLASGASQLPTGTQDLADGIDQSASGARQLSGGLTRLSEGGTSWPMVEGSWPTVWPRAPIRCRPTTRPPAPSWPRWSARQSPASARTGCSPTSPIRRSWPSSLCGWVALPASSCCGRYPAGAGLDEAVLVAGSGGHGPRCRCRCRPGDRAVRRTAGPARPPGRPGCGAARAAVAGRSRLCCTQPGPGCVVRRDWPVHLSRNRCAVGRGSHHLGRPAGAPFARAVSAADAALEGARAIASDGTGLSGATSVLFAWFALGAAAAVVAVARRPATPASGPATSSGQWPRRAEPTGRTPPGR